MQGLPGAIPGGETAAGKAGTTGAASSPLAGGSRQQGLQTGWLAILAAAGFGSAAITAAHAQEATASTPAPPAGSEAALSPTEKDTGSAEATASGLSSSLSSSSLLSTPVVSAAQSLRPALSLPPESGRTPADPGLSSTPDTVSARSSRKKDQEPTASTATAAGTTGPAEAVAVSVPIAVPDANSVPQAGLNAALTSSADQQPDPLTARPSALADTLPQAVSALAAQSSPAAAQAAETALLASPESSLPAASTLPTAPSHAAEGPHRILSPAATEKSAADSFQSAAPSSAAALSVSGSLAASPQDGLPTVHSAGSAAASDATSAASAQSASSAASPLRRAGRVSAAEQGATRSFTTAQAKDERESTAASAPKPTASVSTAADVPPVSTFSPTVSGAAALHSASPVPLATGSATGSTPHASAATGLNLASPQNSETFAALDAGSSAAPVNWLHTGARHAEAGYQDPNLGWVGVRAEVSNGAVHATLVPSTAAASESLSQHLSGLSTYLSNQDSPVRTVTVAAPEGNSLSSGLQQGGEQNNNAQADSSGAQSSASRQFPASQSSASSTSAVAPADPVSSYIPLPREGSRISLVA